MEEIIGRPTLELDNSPKPFLRWAGGKRKLANLIEQSIPSTFSGEKNRFYEPFVGGGAISFHLGDPKSLRFVPGKNLIINDINLDLYITYKAVKESVHELIDYLKEISKDTSKRNFEKIKAVVPDSNIQRAARFIYLNKTCFNGLWRVNSKGDFNVPWGKLKNPKIFSEQELLIASKRLKSALIRNTTFSAAVEDARKGDLVYFDPPYIPLNATSSFSKYSKDDFGLLDHHALAGVIDGLTKRGVKVILSNSDTPKTREIYSEVLKLKQLNVQRSISAAAGSRVVVKEIIGTNFKVTARNDFYNLKAI